MHKNEVPNPGSKEAIDSGCTCPVMDNCRGRGIPLDGKICFFYAEECPVHAKEGEK